MISVTLNPLLLVHPWQYLCQESAGITLARVDAEFGYPDRLVESLMELNKVVLEVIGIGPGVVVSDNKVDLAVRASSHELLQPVHALVGLVTVGDSGRANLQALSSERLNVLLVGGNGLSNGNVGTSTTSRN
jgi:hypothetical protein